MTLLKSYSPLRLALTLAMALGVALAPLGVELGPHAVETRDGSVQVGTSVKKISEWKRSELKLIRLINKARSRRDIQTLNKSRAIAYEARRHSAKMRAAGEIFHSELGQVLSKLTWRIAGENVGVGPSIKSLHKAFMKSPGHKANVLDERFDRVGVGVKRSGSTFYVTVQFLGR